MAERVTAETRLHRLLHVLPAAAREGGVPLDALARELGVGERDVLRDLEEATAATFHRPAGSADPFSILIEASAQGTTVHVHTTRDFERPARLTPRESLALVLGLRSLAAEVVPDRREDVLHIARRMEQGLGSSIVQADGTTPSQITMDGETSSHTQPDDDPDAVLADAAARQRRCVIRYIKPGGEPEDRTIEPWRLLHGQGAWYVLARDVVADGMRLFRCDRVLRAHIDEAPGFEVPADFDVRTHLPDGVPFASDDVVHVSVRYDAPAARWVAESTGVEPERDGSVVVEHAVADRRWLVREVLRFGGAAAVEAPADLRAEVGASAVRVARQAEG